MANDIYVCDLKECKLYLEHPILLPCCGSTICKEHENKIEKKGGKYKCPVCRKQHQLLLTNGFPVNKKIFDSMKNQNHLSETKKNVIELFPELESIIEQYKPTQAEVTIYDFFAKLRNQIDLHREQMIEEIHKQSEEMLVLLKQQEEMYKKNAENLTKIDLKEVKNKKLPEWKKKIRNPEMSEYEVNFILDEINDKIFEIEQVISKYKNDLFMNDHIEFIPSELCNCFGELKIEKELFVDNILGRRSVNNYTYSLFLGQKF